MPKKPKKPKKSGWLGKLKTAVGIGAVVAETFVKNPENRERAARAKKAADSTLEILDK